MRTRYWAALTSTEFEALDTHRTVAVLPLAAVEQHGPHLAVGTDAVIAQGLIGSAVATCPDDLPILVLPTQAIGASNEHLGFAGTLTLAPATALAVWLDIVGGIARSGLQKLVLVSSHGGNSEVVGLLAREARIRHRMACVATSWQRFGFPEGLFSADEIAHGIHGGAIETSLMLHFKPDLVDMAKAADFRSAAVGMATEFTHLRATGRHALGWMAKDLHPSGAVGDATQATAEKGRLTAAHQVAGFLALLRDIAQFSLDRLA